MACRKDQPSRRTPRIGATMATCPNRTRWLPAVSGAVAAMLAFILAYQ